MKKKIILSTVSAAVLALSPMSSHAAELLLNGNFESPALSAGDHIGTNVPDSWTVAPTSTATTSTVADSNIVNGTETNGSGVKNSSQYLQICPDDPGGMQSLDGVNGTVYVSQPFTLSTASALEVKIDFGGRDSTSGTSSPSSWEILDSAGNVAYTSATAKPNGYEPATGSWVKSDIIPNFAFASGAYQFVAVLSDPDMLDAASVTTVPEPSTFAAVGLGASLLGWVGFKRRRKG